MEETSSRRLMKPKNNSFPGDMKNLEVHTKLFGASYTWITFAVWYDHLMKHNIKLVKDFESIFQADYIFFITSGSLLSRLII
ncbi:hypothetical protein RclHR1_02150004 [Rhizophagus clarus]|uniref:Uncharacterized protein n=1 Tax=Rhizophagus clarus TaxID=94130 RepID=A0A2Z6QT19_9GLOM|nr:hypothetical protein RclHR1_02150004 [Rhizophagus clarus]